MFVTCTERREEKKHTCSGEQAEGRIANPPNAWRGEKRTREKVSAYRSLLRSRAMKITLSDESLLSDLLAFLRKEGCVAYYEGDSIEAVRPRSFWDQEATELRLVIDRWRNEHPETGIELSD